MYTVLRAIVIRLALGFDEISVLAPRWKANSIRNVLFRRGSAGHAPCQRPWERQSGLRTLRSGFDRRAHRFCQTLPLFDRGTYPSLRIAEKNGEESARRLLSRGSIFILRGPTNPRFASWKPNDSRP
jgi:hypothetical protein